MAKNLPEPTPYDVPPYYVIEPRKEKPAAEFLGNGWEVGIYKRHAKTREIMNEPVDDKANDDGSESPGYYRSYHGFRFALVKVVRAFSVDLKSKIDEPNTASIEVPLGGDPVGIVRDEVYPFDTAIEVTYNGFSMFSGIVWTCRADFFKQSLTINAGDFLSFQKYRTSERTRMVGVNKQTQPMDILDGLWCCAMRSSNLNAGIHAAIRKPAGRPANMRPVTLGYGQWNPVLDSLYKWADSRDGFYIYDGAVRVPPSNINHKTKAIGTAYAAPDPEDESRTGCGVDSVSTGAYPFTTLIPQVYFTKSRLPTQLKVPNDKGVLEPLKLVDRENCEVTDLFIDASSYANISTAVGVAAKVNVGTPDDQVWVPRAVKFSPGMCGDTEPDGSDGSRSPVPIKDLVVKYNIRVDDDDPQGKVNLKLLEDKAAIQLARSREPSIIPSVRVYPDQIHPGYFRQANFGQYLRLESRNNEYASIDGDYMIVGTRITAEKSGTAIIDLDLTQRSKFELPDD